MTKRMFICNDNATGIFSAIYDAWEDGRRGNQVGITLRGQLNQELFCEYFEVEETQKKAAAVERMIKKNLGFDVYWDIYHAILANDSGKADAVLKTMLAARTIPDSRRIMTHLSHPMVEKVFELSRSVGNEAHLFTGFIRFCELENGVLFSEITPKAQVLTCIADHFADRFPLENWMIYDKTHKMFLVHEAKKQWVLVTGEKLDDEMTKKLSKEELEYERLWRAFCRTISIENRQNISLQTSNLPHHYRINMVEFDK